LYKNIFKILNLISNNGIIKTMPALFKSSSIVIITNLHKIKRAEFGNILNKITTFDKKSIL